MRQKNVIRLIVFGLLGCIVLAIYLHRKEGFAALAPGTSLAWTGTQWNICDDPTNNFGMDLPPSGGVVIASDVSAMQVERKDYVLAKTRKNEWIIIKMIASQPDDVQIFTTETAWVEAVKTAGLATPSLLDPAAFYK